MMKLRAFLKSADPKETLFIGSGSSFLCIGERRIVKKDMPKISVEKKASFKDALDYETKKLERLYDELRKDPDMEVPEEKISFIEKRIYNLRDILKDYKDMMEREVIESYPRMKGDGTVVIIEGCEQGSYWLKSEYDRRKKMLYIRENDFYGVKLWMVMKASEDRKEEDKAIAGFSSEEAAVRFLWKRDNAEKKVDRETIAALSLMLGDWTVSDKCKKYIRKAIGSLEGMEEE